MLNNNIFFKSMMRQPIRALILSVLMGAAAFAFVARATEFIVVRDELGRIEAFYRSIGILSPLRFNNFTVDHDVTRALDIVEGSRHVAISDTRRFTQGVFADRLGLAAQGQLNYFNPALNNIDVRVLDHYFIGYRDRPIRLSSPHDSPFLIVWIAIEEMIAGDPTALRVGYRVFSNEWGQTHALRMRQEMRLHLTYEEARLFEQGLWCPFDGLGMNERALFRASPLYVIAPGGFDARSGMLWYLRSLTGDDGFEKEIENHNPRVFGGYYPRFNVKRTGTEGLKFSVREADAAAFNGVLEYLHDELVLIRENLSSVMVVETHDMTAMPRFTDPRTAFLVHSPTYYGGRFLTHEDYGRPVAVVPISLAVRRGLHVGENFTITLRDNPRPAWIDTHTHSVWARGVENWWDNSPSGWWSMICSDNDSWRDSPTYELELTVVGVFLSYSAFFHNFTASEIFIPAGVMPSGFGWDASPHLTGMYSFVLDSPRMEEAFLRETRAELYAMGFRASFIPNGFEHIASATDPIRMSITVNLIVFGAASALILAFAVLLYIRQWRKTVAIAQALGIPRGNVLRGLFTPVVVLWVPAMMAGGVFAWFFAIGQAEVALAAIASYETAVMPEIYLLPVMCGLLIVFILVGVWLGGYSIVRHPVLAQLQGSTQKRSKTEHTDPGAVPEGFAMDEFELEPLPVTGGFSASARAALSHCARHIYRTPVKTVLALFLAVLLVFSLGWLSNTIYFTEAEVLRLWDTTIIEAEIFRDAQDEAATGFAGVISPDAWSAIEFSGFLRDAYLEAVAWSDTAMFLGVSHLEGLIAENTKTVVDEQLGVICSDMEIEFMPGFGPYNFVNIPDAPTPLVIRRGMFVPDYLAGKKVQVIGVFDGGLQRAVNRFGHTPVYIMPVESHRGFFSGRQPFYGERSLETYHPPFMTARFTIDPARNRDIEQLRELVIPPLGNNDLGVLGRATLLLHVNDDVIYNVVVPMEENASFLRVLYPIAIGVAFLLALGLSVLTMLQNAKNAAIMRVLGKPRVASQVMLTVEQLMVSVAGTLLGLVMLFVFVAVSVAPLYLAGLYFGGAAIGSVVGAFVISMRAPLDLLQVKE